MSDAAITAEQAFEAGRTAYPSIDLARDAFIRFAEERSATWQGDPERAADLYLACACVQGVPAAISEFLTKFGERIPLYLGRLARHSDTVAEVRQILVTRCLVGDSERQPALIKYSGTGSLEGWLRATAVREALAINRESERNSGNVEAVLEAQMPWADREISLFKQIYREPVNRAFAAACNEIGAEDRALLRLHYVDGVTTQKLADMYNISRATIIRRLADARQSLVDHVKASLRQTTGIEDRDFESVLLLLKSQIDLRLSVVLR
jgi:RNA polymerase sigma-70 factor, ECF subfamily